MSDSPSHGCSTSSCAPCNLQHTEIYTCKNGSCAELSCAAGFADCNGNPADGCETNLENDPAHCGSCGIDCTQANIDCVYCQQGACTVPGCPVGYADCNCNPSDACEVDLRTDPSNCGFCGHACASGQSCVNAVCT